MKREEREVYMSLKVSDIDIKIEKAEKEMAALNEKINKKKKEIAVLKKQRHAQELKERTKRNEEIVSELEEKLGVGISEDMINKFVEFQKQNFENTNLGDADYEKMVSSNSN
jgi:oligoendopeptidase F